MRFLSGSDKYVQWFAWGKEKKTLRKKIAFSFPKMGPSVFSHFPDVSVQGLRIL